MTDKLPAVEGLTPDILWYTVVGLVGIGALILLVDKVSDVFRKAHERRRLSQSQPGDALAESISQKVLESLEPRFEEIDKKLANDKALIDSHTRQLAAQEHHMDAVESGNKVLCRGVLALLSHEINGNSIDKLRESQKELTDYLIDK